VTHVPAPSQLEAGVNVVVPAGQLAAPHGAPCGYFWQAPFSHMPFVPQVVDACTAHVPDGSGAPPATFTHWPIVPASAHDLHALVQADEQQTPWAQKVDSHSAPCEQNAPLFFLPHELWESQVFGGTQSPLVPQDVKQREPLHA
jgi:hypothetical protein